MGLGVATPARANADLPSGQAVTFLDAYVEIQGNADRWLILRYLAPQIGHGPGEIGYDDAVADLDHLCATDGLQSADAAGGVAQVVILLLDREVPRGASDPSATKFIGAYIPSQQGCIWQ